MTYIRGDRAEFDSWEEIGNPGWNWNAMNAAWLSLEKFFPPTAQLVANGASYTAQDHGTNGAVHVGFDPTMTGGPFFGVANETWSKLGIPHTVDFNGGSTRGFAAHQQTLDPIQNYRWDAATAFYWPIASSRPNLHLLAGQASSIWFNSGSGNKVAGGVRFHPNSDPNAIATPINVRREIILCAGSLRSPLILEQSGIGNSTLLQKLDIPVVVNLPGVGLNLDDQPSNTLFYSSNFSAGQNYNTAYATFVTAADLFGSKLSTVSATVKSSIPRWAAQLSGGDSTVASALQTQFQIQHDLMFNQGITVAEFVTQMGGNTATVDYWNLFPFGRGSVHLKAKSDYVDNLIDIGWFRIDFDRTMQTAIGRFAARLWATAPANHYITGRVNPNPSTLPDDATDAQWDAFHRSTCGSPDHPQGTLAMKSRSLLGVVDSNLLVYGTANVRVADASVIPTQFSGHTSAIVYAIAQRASEAILGTLSTSEARSADRVLQDMWRHRGRRHHQS